MKNNNSLSKFKQVLQLSGFKDVTKVSESIQLEMAQGERSFLIMEYSNSKYSIDYKDSQIGRYSHMGLGNENQAMDYIREILMEVA